jgi:hypothetical protein
MKSGEYPYPKFGIFLLPPPLCLRATPLARKLHICILHRHPICAPFALGALGKAGPGDAGRATPHLSHHP